MAKTQLDQNEFCVFLGEKVAATPTVSEIKRKSTNPADPKIYELTLKFELEAQTENLEATPKDLGRDASFATFKQGEHRTGAVLMSYITESGSDDLHLSLRFKTTGIKGNHGA